MPAIGVAYDPFGSAFSTCGKNIGLIHRSMMVVLSAAKDLLRVASRRSHDRIGTFPLFRQCLPLDGRTGYD
jgi:hypothetical protein